MKRWATAAAESIKSWWTQIWCHHELRPWHHGHVCDKCGGGWEG